MNGGLRDIRNRRATADELRLWSCKQIGVVMLETVLAIELYETMGENRLSARKRKRPSRLCDETAMRWKISLSEAKP